ncbi:hypothetical protein Droror1_Dr00024524 [Drosera rotundifolia]
MYAEPEVEKQDSTTEITDDQIVNKDLASVEEEQTQDELVDILESTIAAEQVVVTNFTLIDEQADMLTETEVEKEDSKIAIVEEIVEDMINIKGEQTQDKSVESTPQCPMRVKGSCPKITNTAHSEKAKGIRAVVKLRVFLNLLRYGPSMRLKKEKIWAI